MVSACDCLNFKGCAARPTDAKVGTWLEELLCLLMDRGMFEIIMDKSFNRARSCAGAIQSDPGRFHDPAEETGVGLGGSALSHALHSLIKLRNVPSQTVFSRVIQGFLLCMISSRPNPPNILPALVGRSLSESDAKIVQRRPPVRTRQCLAFGKAKCSAIIC